MEDTVVALDLRPEAVVGRLPVNADRDMAVLARDGTEHDNDDTSSEVSVDFTGMSAESVCRTEYGVAAREITLLAK